MKTFIQTTEKSNITWNGALEGADSIAAIAAVATVTMPKKIAHVPERAVHGPESFLASGNGVESQNRPVRESGHGR